MASHAKQPRWLTWLRRKPAQVVAPEPKPVTEPDLNLTPLDKFLKHAEPRRATTPNPAHLVRSPLGTWVHTAPAPPMPGGAA